MVSLTSVASRPHPIQTSQWLLPYTLLFNFVFRWTQLVLVLFYQIQCLFFKFMWYSFFLGLLFHKSLSLALPWRNTIENEPRLWANDELRTRSRWRSMLEKAHPHKGIMRLGKMSRILAGKSRMGLRKERTKWICDGCQRGWTWSAVGRRSSLEYWDSVGHIVPG